MAVHSPFLLYLGAQMAGFYGRGAPAPSVPAPHERGGTTGDGPQSQPVPTPTPAQPAPSERRPSPPQQPKGPEVQCYLSSHKI